MVAASTTFDAKARPCHCGVCRRCWLAENSPRYQRHWGLPEVRPVALKPPGRATCLRRGEVLETRSCDECGGKLVEVFACDLHGICTDRIMLPIAEQVECCRLCHHKVTEVSPLKNVRMDSDKLVPGEAGARFNASLARYQSRLLMAYRTGWCGSQIHIADLDEDYQVLGNTTIHLKHQLSNYGREDPRLFLHKGKLHLSYIGVKGHSWKTLNTNQLYCELSDDLKAGVVHDPAYAMRQSWEKNWAFFEWSGLLLAVYQIHPHKVFHIVGDQAFPFAEVDYTPQWSGGALRGGAAPVLVGDEYWCFFHGARDVHGLRTYSTGVYTFEASPPFRPLRMTANPILDAHTPSKPQHQWASVVFTCGAILEGNIWRLSSGIHDRWIEIHEFDHRQLERAMVKL